LHPDAKTATNYLEQFCGSLAPNYKFSNIVNFWLVILEPVANLQEPKYVASKKLDIYKDV
jgi:hypothetical protein